MKLNIQNIIEAEKVLESIAFDENIKGRYAIKLLKNLEVLKKEVDRFDKLREPIIKRYCDKDEKGEPIIENNSYIFNNEKNKIKMFEEINELLIAEINLDIEIIEFSAIENINISMAHLSQIRFMLNMEE